MQGSVESAGGSRFDPQGSCNNFDSVQCEVRKESQGDIPLCESWGYDLHIAHTVSSECCTQVALTHALLERDMNNISCVVPQASGGHSKLA